MFLAGVAERSHGAEPAGQQHRHRLADVMDAEPEEEGGERPRLGVGDAPYQLRRRLLREPLERHEPFGAELVEVRDVADQLRVEQLAHPLVAEAADVHRLSGGEVDDPFRIRPGQETFGQ